jgi:hypothetical protein
MEDEGEEGKEFDGELPQPQSTLLLLFHSPLLRAATATLCTASSNFSL